MWSEIGHNILELLRYNPQEPLLFNSGLFLFLFTGVMIFYGVMRGAPMNRILFLSLFSYYFYYKSSGVFLLVLVFISISDFLIARRIYATHKLMHKRLWMLLSLCIDIGLLVYFKYTNFLFDTFAQLAGRSFDPFDIILPVGISFFTFQSMSYIIDVYRGRILPLGNWLDYNFYLSFFPQLVAGPIVRARDFIPQIRQRPLVTNEMFGRAVYLIIVGLFKKAVISDYISINFVDRIFDNPSLYSGVENLLGVYGYALQIYCDFSGYSDMAIGIALLLGFRFNINFDSPYKSATITEFWRRWHISLSSWLKDYLYISLGGNRGGKYRTYLNLMATMTIGGLWHGASLRFVLWGVLHGAALAVHKFVMEKFPWLTRATGMEMSGWRRFVGIVFTFNLVCVGWVLFRADDMSKVGEIFTQIFTGFHPELFWDVVQGYKLVFVMIALGYVSHFWPSSVDNFFCGVVTRSNLLVKAAMLVGVIWIISQVKSSAILPFIYFQF